MKRVGGALVLLGLCVVAVEAGRQLGLPIESITRDPAMTEGDSPFRGGGSSVGLFLWAAAGTSCLLGATAAGGNRRTFLLLTGAGVLALGVDDALLLHEEAAERLIGVAEWQVYGVYLLVGALWLRRFRSEVGRSDPVPLVVALFAFALSAGIDAVELGRPFLASMEDTAKYFGMAALCWWCVATARLELRSPAREAGPGGPSSRPPSHRVSRPEAGERAGPA